MRGAQDPTRRDGMAEHALCPGVAEGGGTGPCQRLPQPGNEDENAPSQGARETLRGARPLRPQSATEMHLPGWVGEEAEPEGGDRARLL